MSDTAIEDLVDETVGDVLAGQKPPREKREIVRAAYAFQQRFDTSFTMSRHEAGLASIGFERPTPGAGLLPEEPIPSWAPAELALKCLEACPPAKRRDLTLDWYAGLVSRYLEYDLGDDFISGFQEMESDQALGALRAAAIEAGLSGYRRAQNALFSLPTWAKERDSLDSGDIERYHIVRYLLDERAELPKVKKAFQKDLKANSPEARAAFYARIEQSLATILEGKLGFIALPRMEEDSESVWLYYRDRLESQVVPEGAFATGPAERFQREFVRLRFQPDLGGLDVTAAVQNGRILAWQQTTPNTDPAFWHFYSNLFAELDEESPEYKSLTGSGCR